ncbi:MAG TPA: nicotinamidase [Deltaproteobacteria bacterium]|nr:nicotinamidase [Deltaproteobacteria bacterium]
MKTRALVVVDFQNDFCPGGALPVPEGDEIADTLNSYIERFTEKGLPVFASKDWHPAQTSHFKEYGGIWPPHCVMGTKGAEFHPALRLPEDAIILLKGDREDEDAYSVFQAHTEDGRPFKKVLEDMSIEHLYVGGLATDYCVKATVLDALKEGFRVTLLLDAIKGVDVEEGDSERAIEEMRQNGAETITIDGLVL